MGEVRAFIESMKDRNITLTSNKGRIKCIVPKGIYLNKDERNFIKNNKAKILKYLIHERT